MSPASKIINQPLPHQFSPYLHSHMKKTLTAIWISAGIIFGLLPGIHAQTTTNLLDNFARYGALGGSAPVIAQTVGDTWASSSTTGTTTTNWNGGVLVITNGSYARLPFTPQNGYVYTLSVTQNLTSGSTSDRWGAVGFDNGTQSSAYSFGNVWMLCKWDGTVQAFDNALNGTIVSAAAGTGNKAGTNNLLQIVLDTTTPGGWKAQIKVNGTAVGPVHTLSSTTITYAGLSGNGLKPTLRCTNQLFSLVSIQATAPSITGQPVGLTNWAGANAALNVAASGAQPIAYQWYKDSISNPLSGQTSATLSFSPLDGTNTGSYFAIVTNAFGAQTSSIVSVHAETTTVMALTPSISVVALPTTGTDAVSGLSTNNTYISALDFGNNTSPLSVNNVVFQNIDPTGL